MTKRTHCLLYHPFIRIKDIKPEHTVDQLIDEVNMFLPDLTANKNLIAKLVRLNWMIDNLNHTPIMKPIVVDQNMRTVAGDTRLQALEFHPDQSHINCLMTAPIDAMSQYIDWIYVESVEQLANMLMMDPNDVIVNQDWHFEQLSSLEFALPEAEHHMHDEQARYRAFEEYYTDDFELTREWLETPREWTC